MKRILTSVGIFSLGLFLASGAYAHDKHHHANGSKMWKCETNASSALSASDKKADDMMSKKSMSGRDAFNFAMKHCRDCTKVTCSTSEEKTDSSKTDSSKTD